MADTIVEATMDIVEDLGGSGEPYTAVEALELLRETITGGGGGDIALANKPITNEEIDAIISA